MNTILVTGATGNVGRPLIDHLLEADVAVRAVTRRPEAARFPCGVEAVASVRDGIDGASAVFLNSRALGDELATIACLARRSGVSRLVALSAINADDDFSRQPSRFRADRNLEVEQIAVESGLEWVSLRPTVFASNFIGMWAPQIRSGDVISGPYAEASTAPIADADISAVAARALVTDDLVGQKVPLTGPHAPTNTELVDVIGGVLGRPLRYQEVTPDLVRQRFVGLGFGSEFADAYMGLLEATLAEPAFVTHDVEKILGRGATTFADAILARRNLFTN